MDKWIHDNLSELLDFPVPNDLTEYIMKIQNERDLDEYLKTLLNYNDPKHRQFIAQLKKRQGSLEVLGGNKKNNSNDSASQKQNDKKKSKTTKQKEAVQEKLKDEPEKVKIDKKKPKFVNLYSEEGQDRETVLLKGRHKCDCEARQHRLVNNCINCGRIVCIQEGSGPCFFCEQLVCSPEQQQILSMNTKQSGNLYNKLMEQKPNKSFEESMKKRDKLLEYDRNCAQRTKVIDDESDYFQTSTTWLTKEERATQQKHEEDMLAKKHASRLAMKVTLDFAGRKIIDEGNHFEKNLPMPENSEELARNREFVYPENELIHRPTYIHSESVQYDTRKNDYNVDGKNRIQDKEYLEMSDSGMCLSMHQPFASLLVAGIKIHEGRTWYTSHRGRLWIASAAKVPSMEEINTIENQYQAQKDENIKFPNHYPTGCLLGCVTVVNVLSQEEYRKLYPDGESDSPYVYICEDPYQLTIRFPLQGKHKIYKMDPKIHRAAVNSLEKVKINMKNCIS